MQASRNPRAVDQRRGQDAVQRRQVHRLVGLQVGGGAAGAEADPGAEHHLVAQAQAQLRARLRLALHQQAVDAAIRPLLRRAGQHGEACDAHALHVAQPDRDAADLGLARQFGAQQLEHHREADLHGRLARLGRAGDHAARDGRHAIGIEDAQRLGLVQRQPAPGAHRVQQPAHRRAVGREVEHVARRQLRRGIAVAPVLRQMQRASHRSLRGGKDGDAGLGEKGALRAAGRLSEPAHQDRRAADAAEPGHGGGHGVAVFLRVRRMDRHHRAHFRQRGDHRRHLGQPVPLAMRQDERVAAMPARRQGEMEHRPGRLGDLRQPAAAAQRRIGRHLPGGESVGDHGDPVGLRAAAQRGDPDPRQRFRRREEFGEIGHPEHAGAAQRRLHHRVRAAEGLPRGAAGADRHHGAGAGRGAGGGDELPPVLDAPEIEQHGIGGRVARQPVQRAGEAVIRIAADARDQAEAEALGLGIVQDRPGQGGGLAEQRELSRPGHEMRQGGVEAQRRHRQPEGALPQGPHAAAAREGGEIGRGDRHHRRVAAPGGEGGEGGGLCLRRQGDHGEVRRFLQSIEVWCLLQPVPAEADRVQRALEPPGDQVPRQDGGLRQGWIAQEGHALRREKRGGPETGPEAGSIKRGHRRLRVVISRRCGNLAFGLPRQCPSAGA